ncbi:flagellar basal body rod protein FlgG [Schinkia azotoformans]|uniref:Flagellar basal body rod protein FlgG n=1 Tax=Schinkia azotoformans LMG 9581 TaxID=1131731 RepID=K6D6G2_SCHAZ|nr:flagellar basal body rod protein FlgG [Schinkia azotoformans]EKN63889.1 flagellar basal body rod protein FlgG [Schinkia azotoformans LMG 9581]MEC1638247.1 flagellar basal body rod protein FlgG [Schinkia azotoformans]MEC1946319.1 flagellar basal body rod protein FlgG [Schinkia azotoformans]
MLRSMYSGISGMKNFQTKLDVIGNNIANVNTYGFKKGRVTFSDLYSQQISGATGATGTRGGVNPRQVGLGAQLASIDTIYTPGSTQSTGRPLDLAITGDGYFQVKDPGGNILFTRAGNFYFDENNGDIVNSDGYHLVGTGGKTPLNIPADAESFSIGADGTISYIPAGGGTVNTSQKIELMNFSNPGGLTKVGGNLFQESDNSGTATAMKNPKIQSGALEMSNVDLSEEFTEMIVAQRGFQANTKIITTSDEILQELVNLKR